MSKSKIVESHTLSFEGVLDNENMQVEVEDIGAKRLQDLLARFNGCNIKVSVSLKNEVLD